MNEPEQRTQKRQRGLVALTCLLLAAAIWALAHWRPETLPPPILIETNGKPMLGKENAPLRLVVFQDPFCEECRLFANSTWSRLQQEFLMEGKANYTIIPIALDPRSDGAAALWNGIQSQAGNGRPELFFNYVNDWYATTSMDSDASPGELLAAAEREFPSLDEEALRSGLESAEWEDRVVKDTAYARALTTNVGSAKAPMVFVNGMYCEDPKADALFKMMNQVLKKRGSASL